MYDVIDTPRLARPAFVSWQGSDRAQTFPNDPKLDAYRDAQLRAAGKIIVRRRSAREAA